MYPGTHAARTPDKPAVVMVDTRETLTYAELDERSVRLAHVLRGAGLRPGDCVALVSENSPRYFEAYWAALRSGLYFTAVDDQLTADDVTFVVDDCGAKALLVSAAKRHLAELLTWDTPQVRLRLAFGGVVEGYEDYEDALAAASAEPLVEQPPGADMLYSSGTTGRPKGVKAPLPDRQVDEPGDLFTGFFGPLYRFGADTLYLSTAPLYHAAPLRFGGIVQALGGTVHVMAEFGPVQALRAIEDLRITHSQWVPTMFVRLLKLPEDVRRGFDVSSLRVAIHAAAPCPIEVKRSMIDWWGPILFEYYAATEGNGITFIDSEQWLLKPGSVGRAGLGAIHVCDDDGNEQPAGEVGLVYFERDVLPFVYHNDPDRTRFAQHPRHATWTTTGDVGHVDAGGYLFLTDRKEFVIVSGGATIYPQEVEDCLVMNPAVLDVAVVGVPDDELGEAVLAIVQPAPGVAPGPELEHELIGYARARIADFKVPRLVEFVDRLPRTATGKLLKGLLRRTVRVLSEVNR